MIFKKKWYSTLLRFTCLIENIGSVDGKDSVFIFKATSFKTALKEALKIGRENEEIYKNEDGNNVKWILKEVISLDYIGKLSQACEVYSNPIDQEQNGKYEYNHKFLPENSDPTQTI